jgi:hypothetical protein
MGHPSPRTRRLCGRTSRLWETVEAIDGGLHAPVVKGDFGRGRLAATDRPTPGMRMRLCSYLKQILLQEGRQHPKRVKPRAEVRQPI